MKLTELEGKVVVITGAGRGIGLEEAKLFASHGARIVINDLGGASSGGGGDTSVAQQAVNAVKAAGGEAVAETSSVSSWEGGARVVEAALDSFGRIDILVNNAGIARPASIEVMEEQDYDLVTGVNLKGYFATIRHAAPHFIKQRSGIIVNKSSPSGFGHYNMSAYTAAKEGVVGLSRSVAKDLGQYNVRCNAIRPFAGGSQMGTPRMAETLSDDLGFPPLWNRPRGMTTGVAPAQSHVAALTVWLSLEATRNVNGREFFIGGSEIGIFPEGELERVAFDPAGWSLETLLNPANAEYLIGRAVNRFGPRG